MSRLPVPGSDKGVWGTILNDFLSQSLNADGTIKSSALTGAGAETTTNKGAASGYAPLDSTSKVPTVNLGGSGASSSTYLRGDQTWTTPRLDQLSAPTSSVSLNSQKITNLANGAASSDAAAFGQIPVAGTTAGTYAAGNDSRITGAIQSSTVTTKGDLIAATGASTVSRVGVGNDGQVLVADSTQNTGIKWGTSGAGLGANTYTGTQTAPAFAATGLSGATSASRYVGATTSGAPVAGTFLLGDFIVDQSGKLWVCTTAGSPGTWTQTGVLLESTTAPPVTNTTGSVLGTATTAAHSDHTHKIGTHASTHAPNGSDPIQPSLMLPPFTWSGGLVVTTGTMALPIDSSYTITGVNMRVGTAPVGSSLIVDVLKNGSTIFTTTANRPTIAANTNSTGPGATPDVTSLVSGDYLTINIAQVGSTTAGSDLVVSVLAKRTA